MCMCLCVEFLVCVLPVLLGVMVMIMLGCIAVFRDCSDLGLVVLVN